jgi:hypothetical protein
VALILDTNALSAVADGEDYAIKLLGRAERIAVPVIVLGDRRRAIGKVQRHQRESSRCSYGPAVEWAGISGSRFTATKTRLNARTYSSVGGKKGCHQMTDDCTENHLIRAIEADDALTDELIAMVRHTGCPDDDNLREARYDLATEFIHSDAVYAALKLAPRARRARLNTLWREWQNKFQTPEGRAEEKALLEEMKKAEEQK